MRTGRRESWPCGEKAEKKSRRWYHAHASPTKAASATPAGRTRSEPPAPATRPVRLFTRHESRNTNHGLYGRSGRVGAKGSQTKIPPPGPPRPPPSHCFPARVRVAWRGMARQPCCPVAACLFTIVRHCSVFFGGWGVPRSQCSSTGCRSGWASRRTPLAAAPVALRARSAAVNAKGSHAEKGERSILR